MDCLVALPISPLRYSSASLSRWARTSSRLRRGGVGGVVLALLVQRGLDLIQAQLEHLPVHAGRILVHPARLGQLVEAGQSGLGDLGPRRRFGPQPPLTLGQAQNAQQRREGEALADQRGHDHHGGQEDERGPFGERAARAASSAC